MKAWKLIGSIILIYCFFSCSKRRLEYRLEQNGEVCESFALSEENWVIWGNLSFKKDSRFSGCNLKLINSDSNSNNGILTTRVNGPFSNEEIIISIGATTDGSIEGDPYFFLNFDNQSGRLTTDTLFFNKYENSYQLKLKIPQSAESMICGFGVMNTTLDITAFHISTDVAKLDGDIQKRSGLQPGFNTLTFNGRKLLKWQESDYQDFELLCRVWGLLKYFHPRVTAGAIDMDSALFNFLPFYSNYKKSREKLLINWIRGFGYFDPNVYPKVRSKLIDDCTDPSFGWIDKMIESQVLRQQLFQISSLGLTEGHYVKFQNYVGSPIITNERIYSKFFFPNDELMILTLFRYWNIIEYLGVNKHLSNPHWSKVLKEFLPRYKLVDSRLSFELLTLELIATLRDSHSFSTGVTEIESATGFYRIPVEIEFVENEFIVTEVYQSNYPIEVGDILREIESKPIQNIVDSLAVYLPASHKGPLFRDMSTYLIRSKEKKLNVLVEREEYKSLEIELIPSSTLGQLKVNSDYENKEVFRVLKGNVGFLDFNMITVDNFSELRNKAFESSSLIIDMRGYPITSIGNSLGYSFSAQSRLAAVFFKGESCVMDSVFVSPGQLKYEAPVVLLINEKTQSATEYSTLLLNSSTKVTVLGSRTAGTIGNTFTVNLPGGINTNVTGIRVYSPSYGFIQGIGILPDVEVKKTRSGIIKKKDELLEAALKLLNDRY